jgi:hypothetical protein
MFFRHTAMAGIRPRLPRFGLRDGAAADAAGRRVRERVAGRLAGLGVREALVDVETCAGLERGPGGKH